MKDGKISIRVEDNGIPFDPAARQTSELKDQIEDCKIGGLGLHLVKKIMDDIVYERQREKERHHLDQIHSAALMRSLFSRGRNKPAQVIKMYRHMKCKRM